MTRTQGSTILWTTKLLLAICYFCLIRTSTGNEPSCPIDSEACRSKRSDTLSPTTVVIKIGGSSITHKAEKETLNSEALTWFSSTLQSVLLPEFLSLSSRNQHQKGQSSYCNDTNCHPRRRRFVVIHGAGSFGHHTAKEYGLKGFSKDESSLKHTDVLPQDASSEKRRVAQQIDNYLMEGLVKTRLSVQSLNRHVVESLINAGINAVGISPCFAIHPGYWPGHENEKELFQNHLATVVQGTLDAGLVPVLHGDACLTSRMSLPISSSKQRHQQQHLYAGILSGDTLMEILGQEWWVDEAIFLSDVDGVFTSDPKREPHAELLRVIEVNATDKTIVTGQVATSAAGASSHAHDVTGGLKVSRSTVW